MRENKTDERNYEDIIGLRHHQSSTHPQMSIHDRAAQFSPFAALTGYDGAIQETARLTDRRVDLDETEKAILDEKLRILQERIALQPEVQIQYFKADPWKEGGSYIGVNGVVKKIDLYQNQIVLTDGTIIPIVDILDLTGDVFQRVNNFS